MPWSATAASVAFDWSKVTNPKPLASPVTWLRVVDQGVSNGGAPLAQRHRPQAHTAARAGLTQQQVAEA